MKRLLVLLFLFLANGCALKAMEGGGAYTKEIEFADIHPEVMLYMLEQVSDPQHKMDMAKAFQYGLKDKIENEERREKIHKKLGNIVQEAQKDLQGAVYALSKDEAQNMGFNFRLPIIYFEIKNETDKKVELGDKNYELQPGELLSFKEGALKGKITIYEHVKSVDITYKYNFFTGKDPEVVYQVTSGEEAPTAWIFASLGENRSMERIAKSLDDFLRIKITITLHQDGRQSIDIAEMG